MVTKNDYSENKVSKCFSVLLELMTILGAYRKHIVLIGGNVPPLLLPNAGESHVGSLDVDIALDFKHIKMDSYQTILEILKEKGYYQKEGSPSFVYFRDLQDEYGEITTIELNLLSGEYGGTGKSHRHQKIQEIKARKARGADMVFDFNTEIKISGHLPDGAENDTKIKIPTILPFLVMKGMALWDRKKEKDAYDIWYCCKYYPGGIAGLVKEIKPFINNKLVIEGFGKIKAKFITVNHIGPNWVADFFEIQDTEERERIKREAFEMVNTIMDNLGIAAYEDKI